MRQSLREAEPSPEPPDPVAGDPTQRGCFGQGFGAGRGAGREAKPPGRQSILSELSSFRFRFLRGGRMPRHHTLRPVFQAFHLPSFSRPPCPTGRHL